MVKRDQHEEEDEPIEKGGEEDVQNPLGTLLAPVVDLGTGLFTLVDGVLKFVIG